jgi:glycerophosphoryl diester phosphodiesterase
MDSRAFLSTFFNKGTLLATVLSALGVLSSVVALSDESKLPLFPKLQIHRGYTDKGKNVENTLAAFRAVKAAGHQMFELDVRLSKDRVVVVYHDETLKRLAKVDKKVGDLTAKELVAYGIPTLKEVFVDPRIPSWINVEMKVEPQEDRAEREFEKAVYSVIKEQGAEKRVVVTSFSANALARMAAIAPHIPRGYLVSKDARTETDEQFINRVRGPLAGAKTKLLSLYHMTITKSLADALRKEGLSFFAWTVNDQESATRLLSFGAIGIITDRVDLLPKR